MSMTKFIEVNGREYQLDRYSFKEMLLSVQKEVRDKVAQTIFEKCGCYSANLSQEVILNSQSVLTEEAYQELQMAKPMPLVVMVDDFVVGLSPQEIDAIFYHEVGHLALNHLAEYEGLSLEEKQSCEIQADAFSAQFVPPTHLFSGLYRVIQNSASIMGSAMEKQGKTFDYEWYVSQIWNHPSIAERRQKLGL